MVWAAAVPLIIPRVLAWGWLEEQPRSTVPIGRCGQSLPPHPLALSGALLCPSMSWCPALWGGAECIPGARACLSVLGSGWQLVVADPAAATSLLLLTPIGAKPF